MKTALDKEVYLKVLEDLGFQGITPRELCDRSDLLQAGNGVKRPIPIKTISMALIRLKSEKLAIGIPEGKTRRYWIDPISGQKFLNRRRIMHKMREIKDADLRARIQIDKNMIPEIKEIEGIAKFDEEKWPRAGGFIYFVAKQVISIVNPIENMLDSINLSDQENAELMVRTCTEILNSLQFLEKVFSVGSLFRLIMDAAAA